MTREEAIAELNVLHERLSNPKDCEDGCYSWEDGWYVEAIDMAIEALKDRPHGEWIHREHCQVDEDAYEIATCSHCKAEITLEYPNDNYCPNCGAKMKGGAE